MVFDPAKPLLTNDGYPARIVCTDRMEAKYSFVVLVDLGDGFEGVFVCDEKGRIEHSGGRYIVNIPTKREGWVNIYPVNVALRSNGRVDRHVYIDRHEADKDATPDRVACVKVEWEE